MAWLGAFDIIPESAWAIGEAFGDGVAEIGTTQSLEQAEIASAGALGATAAITNGGKPNIRRKRTASGTLKVPPPIHRRIEPIPSVPNSPQQSKMSRNANMSNTGHQDEVSVMPIDAPVSKIVEDHHTINLSYYSHKNLFRADEVPEFFDTYQFRLNSIWDVDETSSGQQKPLGRDTWASIYQYYRVLSCDYSVKIVNRQNTESLLAGLVLEEDNAVLTTTSANFMMRKNAIRTIIPGNNFVTSSVSQLNYHYNPSTWDHHVQESGIEERWTPINESPSNLHRLFLRLIRADSNAVGEKDIELFISMKFTVQFREANKTILTTGQLS